jgi:hypothetical protein
MLTGKPVDQVVEQFHTAYRETDLSIGDMLRDLNIDFTDYRSSERQSITADGVYLCGVPSLNIQGGMHEVIIEMVDDGEWTVLDPNMGRGDRLYYAAGPTDDPLSVQMAGGYNIDAFVTHETLAAWHTFRVGEAVQ